MKLFNKLFTVLIMLGIGQTAMAKQAQVKPEPIDKIIAVVNDSIISENELNKQIDIVKKQLHESKMPIPDQQALQKQVLQHLIDVEAQMQLAKGANIELSSGDIDDAIKNIAERNNMTLTQLKSAIEASGLTFKKYRENVRKEMTIARLQQQALGRDIVITDDQVEDFIKNNPQQTQKEYHVANILVPLPEAPTPEQVQTAKQKAKTLMEKIQQGENFNKIAVAESSDSFALRGGDLGWRKLAGLPSLFSKEVVKMKKDQITGPLRASNGFHIIKLIDQRSSAEKKFVTTIHVRHILLKSDAIQTAETIENKLNDFRQQIVDKSTSFEEIAKQYSQDISSAEQGGDIGWVHPGKTVPEFEQAMNKLAVNEISQPIKTDYGYHLIQVLGRKDIDDTENYAKQQVRQLLYRRKFSEAVQDWLQTVRSKAYIKTYT